MNRFLKRILVFSIPIVAFLVIVFLIDPYNMFSIGLIKNERKQRISYKLNYPLWKYIEYAKNPAENILIGDSRMGSIESSRIHELTQIDFFNFALGGGTLPEMIDVFWYASQRQNLKRVLFSINFGNFNGREKKNRCVEANSVISNKLLYFINQSTITSSFLLIKELISEEKTNLGKPKQSKELFWRYQLDYTARNLYKDYLYPEDYYRQLHLVASYCRANSIDLQFIILPTHVDLQNRIIELDRKEEFERFRLDLIKLAPVYDFHQVNEVTKDMKLWGDPFHFKDPVKDLIVKTVFEQLSQDHTSICRFYPKGD